MRRLINSVRARRTILFSTLVIAALAFIRGNIGTFAVVEGDSMYPTFKPDDVVRAKTLYTQPQRGDVVVITDDRGDQVMKRVIGLPGETVTLYGGYVYIDRQRISEPYLAKNTYTFKSDIRNERPEECRLGEDQFFVLGDNRLESRDSRDFGPIKRSGILSIVSLPENTARPEFSGIILLGSGKDASAKHSRAQNHPDRIPPRVD